MREPQALCEFRTRNERLRPREGLRIDVEASVESVGMLRGQLSEISRTGLRCLLTDAPGLRYLMTQAPGPATCTPAKDLRILADGVTVTAGPATCTPAKDLRILADGVTVTAGPATIRRCEPVVVEDLTTGLYVLALAFDAPQDQTLEDLAGLLVPKPYVRDELLEGLPAETFPGFPSDLEQHTLLDFYRDDVPNLFSKCERFYGFVKELQRKRIYQALYRVTLTTGLDHRITVFNPIRRTEQEMICFDSNSYLGLHLDSRVIAATKCALDEFGYGTPSAQLLCGTNRHLRELEEALCRFHGRDEAIVFPSGYAANVGTITALVRAKDFVARDSFSHASIHDGCRATHSRFQKTYPHGDISLLEEFIVKAEAEGCAGKLIATDGVFSMHGRVAPLPELRAVAQRHGAKLMVDEAHATGILGPTGRGLEEHFGLPGAIDVLMGTFSKAPGTVGGYVCGSREVIYYLRFYANAGMFTATLPAAICAGVTTAFRLMEKEPEHRERLWENVRMLVPALRDAGFIVPAGDTPIITVFLGSSKLMLLFSRDLYESRIKCGTVAFPAVPIGEAIVRMAVNARHTPEDLSHTVAVFSRLGKRYGILGRTPEEIVEIGERLSLSPEDG